jgi:hypothetical protein
LDLGGLHVQQNGEEVALGMIKNLEFDLSTGRFFDGSEKSFESITKCLAGGRIAV